MTADPSVAPADGLPLRHRLVIGGALAVVSALAWLATLHQATLMAGMDHSAMTADMRPLPLELALLLVMWTTMMVAMMLPGITPMVTAFAVINRRRRERDDPSVSTAIFVLGYVIAWSLFGVAATALQAGLTRLGLLSPMMQATSPLLAAALFVLAGLYQLSPLKEVCLLRCRSPMSFVLSQWRDGAMGAVAMGIRHGFYCIGCCGGLMLLLFAVAVMDLRWVAALTLMLTAEKLLPKPQLWRRLIAGSLLAIGAGLGVRMLL